MKLLLSAFADFSVFVPSNESNGRTALLMSSDDVLLL